MFKLTKDFLASIAQILILVIVIPLIAFLINADTLIELLQEIPIFETWSDLLYKHNDIDVTSVSLLIYISSFFESIIMALFTHIAVSISVAINARGLPILPTFLGILAGGFVIKLLGVTQGFQIVIYLAIVVIGFLLLAKGVFPKIKVLSTKDILVLIIEGLLAVIMCGYITAVLMFAEGLVAFSKVLMVLAGSIIALVLTYFATGYEKDKEKGIW